MSIRELHNAEQAEAHRFYNDRRTIRCGMAGLLAGMLMVGYAGLRWGQMMTRVPGVPVGHHPEVIGVVLGAFAGGVIALVLFPGFLPLIANRFAFGFGPRRGSSTIPGKHERLD